MSNTGEKIAIFLTPGGNSVSSHSLSSTLLQPKVPVPGNATSITADHISSTLSPMFRLRHLHCSSRFVIAPTIDIVFVPTIAVILTGKMVVKFVSRDRFLFPVVPECFLCGLTVRPYSLFQTSVPPFLLQGNSSSPQFALPLSRSRCPPPNAIAAPLRRCKILGAA